MTFPTVIMENNNNKKTFLNLIVTLRKSGN